MEHDQPVQKGIYVELDKENVELIEKLKATDIPLNASEFQFFHDGENIHGVYSALPLLGNKKMGLLSVQPEHKWLMDYFFVKENKSVAIKGSHGLLCVGVTSEIKMKGPDFEDPDFEDPSLLSYLRHMVVTRGPILSVHFTLKDALQCTCTPNETAESVSNILLMNIAALIHFYGENTPVISIINSNLTSDEIVDVLASTYPMLTKLIDATMAGEDLRSMLDSILPNDEPEVEMKKKYEPPSTPH